MNTFLPEPYIEIVHRQAVGLEPLDSTRPSRIARPLDIAVEKPQSRLVRSRSGRFKLVYGPEVPKPVPPATTPLVDVRFVPLDRRYVPRRLSFSVAAETAVRAVEPGGSVPAPRARR